jgi:hypothetical protein
MARGAQGGAPRCHFVAGLLHVRPCVTAAAIADVDRAHAGSALSADAVHRGCRGPSAAPCTLQSGDFESPGASATSKCSAVIEESGKDFAPDRLPAAECEPLLGACDSAAARARVAAAEHVVGMGGFAERRTREARAAPPPASAASCVRAPSAPPPTMIAQKPSRLSCAARAARHGQYRARARASGM